MGYSRKHTRGKRHGHRKGTRAKRQRGGDASNFVSNAVGGTVTAQFDNVFGNASGGNTIRPLGQQGGGKRRRYKKAQRGGYWAQVINNAIVPLTLFALHKKMSKSRGARTMKRKY
jgi:hypothetical protein